MAVADATFFHGPGGGFPHRTANYVVQTMQRVNRIYRDTVWGSESLTGMGLQIKELRIHPEITSSSKYHKNGKHYNMFDDHASWPDHELLKQFGEDEDVGKFCLAHLFTHRRFAGGVLGLAYIASPRKVAVGGICSHPDMEKAYNTGFSSTKNTKGNNLLTQEAMLVTAHEFGHNWGAEHDAETRECAPDAYSGGGGKFIMYPYAVSGYDENNNKFSPCSQRYISAVLTTRSDSCFQEEGSRTDSLTANVPLCGNGIIDKNEDCDGGGMGLSGLDQCCSRDCKLVGNAVCSSTNFECCKDCQMAPQNILCRGSSKELCQEAAFCTGFSLDCPQSKPLKNNTPCIDEGKCVNGVCLDYCAYEGQLIKKVLKPCRCEDVASSCLRCCRSSHETCRPQNKSSSDSFLQDGRPCNYGYCEAGKCHKTSANMIQRLFDFIERLDSSTFVAFMKSNIVGTIIIFSLVVWIPLSWTISCIDKRREKKSREKNLLFVSNDALLLQSLQSNILANRLKDYNVKDSKLSRSEQFHYQTSANLEKPQYQNYFAADESDPKAVNKYTFYKSSAPMEMETVI
uniref:Peptidase M12B domain-containing protein n=1 Tax=Arion vulgaris TaxID=1028688 RepID=A0A0B7ACT7_9EUPU